jgi:hypothetical protein
MIGGLRKQFFEQTFLFCVICIYFKPKLKFYNYECSNVYDP